MTTTINNEHKILNVPNLRFPEFTDEWKKQRLSDVCSFFSGGTPSSSNKEFYGGEIPFIRSGELHKEKTELFITQSGYDNSSAKMVEVGDLLLAIYGATSGDIAISKINGAINQAIICIRTNHNKKFVESVWNKHVSNVLVKYLQGGQGNLSADIVKQIKFSFPSIIEQKKIADFLSLIDKRIALQSKLIDKLQSLIKGIAHKVSQKGKPNIRLSECLQCTSSTLQESDVAEFGDYPVYGANGIIGFLDTYNIANEAIYIIKDGSGFGSVSYVTGKCSATGTLNTLQAKDGFSLRFLYFMLKVFSFEPYKTGMAIPHIYFKDYGKAKIYCPTYELQNKYADLLSKIEQKAIAEQKILDNLCNQKRHLLSQMFI